MLHPCASPDLPAGRVYVWIRRLVDPRFRVSEKIADCPCCAFWRGVIFGAFVTASLSAALVWGI